MDTNDRILNVDIEEQMKSSYLEYSMSVIVSRALPDVRDGLKPVHRRVLTAMDDLNLSPGRPYRKSAKITGDTTGNYHPHGTQAVYDTLVRMAQDFSLRYPLVDGQGNFGSVDGDSPAAERYTEARLTPVAMELLRDLEKETVDYVPNYDGSRTMPSVMPGPFPNLLCNGTTGIAVGMATNIPPHNLGEVVDGLLALIDNPEMDPKDMLQYVQGPDFPTGALIHGRAGIVDYVTTGRGRVIMRARCEMEELPTGRDAIIVHAIPYYVNKSELILKIANLVRDGVISGIADLADESDRKGMRIVVTLKRDAQDQVVLNQLYKHTAMQSTFGVNNLSLVNGQPKTMSLKESMQHFLDFREVVVVRRTEFDLRKAEDRAHILEGYRIALDNIDAIIALIRASKTTDIARTGLMTEFSLSERQAQAILELRLQRLTGLERDKIEAEYMELLTRIAHFKAVLASVDMRLDIIREELTTIRTKYADERRTEIMDAHDDLSLEDLIPEEDMVVTMSHAQYVKRLAVDTYKTQGRGGRGVSGAALKGEEDWVEELFVANTHDVVMFFTSTGRAFKLKVFQIPEASRTARGKAIVNLLPLEKGESISAFVRIPRGSEGKFFLMFATKRGTVKRTDLTAFANIRTTGIRAIELKEDDQLIDVRLTEPGQHAILALRSGKAIRFMVEDVRPMGRTARGVKGIELGTADDAVVGFIKAYADSTEMEVLSITENGYGKRTPLDEYRLQGRGGKGIITMKTSHRNGPVTSIKAVSTRDEVMIITKKGIIIRTRVSDISVMGRNTQGVRVINLDKGDVVGTVATIVNEEEIDGSE